MREDFLGSLALVGPSGAAIIGITLFVLFLSIGLNLYLRGRFGTLTQDLDDHKRADRPFTERVLNRIMEDAILQRQRQGRDANLQAIIEHHFQTEHAGLLLAERFIRAATGLVIILGLVGTFTGLTLSVGQLVGMLAEDPARGVDVADVATKGLTRALSGMSVAFSASLFGIGSAIVLTLFNVLSNVTDRRQALLTDVEAHLEKMLVAATPAARVGEAGEVSPENAELAQIIADFGAQVAGLESCVMQFGSALQTFAGTTRDFREFNLHLKDNVQRMSLSFADVSEAVKHHVHALREPRR